MEAEGLDISAIQEQLRLLGHDIPDSMLCTYLEQLQLDGTLDGLIEETGALLHGASARDGP